MKSGCVRCNSRPSVSLTSARSIAAGTSVAAASNFLRLQEPVGQTSRSARDVHVPLFELPADSRRADEGVGCRPGGLSHKNASFPISVFVAYHVSLALKISR